MTKFTVNQIQNIHLRRFVMLIISPPIIIFMLLFVLVASLIMGVAGVIDYFFDNFSRNIKPILTSMKKSWLG